MQKGKQKTIERLKIANMASEGKCMAGDENQVIFEKSNGPAGIVMTEHCGYSQENTF